MTTTRLKVILFLLISFHLSAQMTFNGQSLFGNEWISPDQSYLKFNIEKEGIYTISIAELNNAGFPTEAILGRELQLYTYGQQVPIHVSSNGSLNNSDFVEFYAIHNKGELDQTLYEDWTLEQLNTEYSLYSDIKPYFITWESGSTNNNRLDNIENNLSGTLPAVSPFYDHEELITYNTFHHSPQINSDNVRYSHYTAAEGFGNLLARTNVINIPTNDYVSSGGGASLEVRFGGNGTNHNFDLKFNNEIIDNIIFDSYGVRNPIFGIDGNLIQESNSFEINGKLSNFDRSTIAFVKLTYPRAYNANGEDNFKFNFDAHSFDKYVEIQNFSTSQSTYTAVDINNNERYAIEVVGDNVPILFPRTDNRRTILINSTNANNLTASDFENIVFKDFNALNPEYVIVSSKKLSQQETGSDILSQYASYRSSPEGYNYQVEVIYIEDIIDQFAFGVAHHPISLKNWSAFLKDSWSQWEYLFLIGKGIQYGEFRKGLNEEDTPNLIPTWGDPGSDNLLFSNGLLPHPIVPIGRIAARNIEEVELYLEKAKAHANIINWASSIEGRAWMKNLMHLGGASGFLGDQINEFLIGMEEIIETNQYAGDVLSFRKETNDPIQSSVSNSIISRINEGISIMTFFGHSAVGTFDFSIEDPSEYDNFEKYPLIISLGCYSGNIHTAARGISENFVLIEDRGAVAFYASSSTAYIGPQNNSGKTIYDYFGDEYYGESIGFVFLEALKSTYFDNFQVETLQEQLTLHGDPALRLYPFSAPDYITDFGSIRTNPEILSTDQASFNLEFDILNLGLPVDEILNYQIIHASDAGYLDTIEYSIQAPANKTSVSANIPLDKLRTAGKNTIEIILDHPNAIVELPNPDAESNNSLTFSDQVDGYDFFVLNDNPVPFDPYEFAIVNKQNITLKASTGNAFINPTNYIVEIDTTELFNSPFKKSEVIRPDGGLIIWDPEVVMTNNTVYYWRVRVETSSSGQVLWNNSSFIYLEDNSEGWNQSHHYQYIKDDFNNLIVEDNTTEFNFTNTLNEIKVTNFVMPLTQTGGPAFLFNNLLLEEYFPVQLDAGIMIAVFDPVTLDHWTSPPGGSYGDDYPVTASRDKNAFQFKTDTEEQRREAIDFIQNIIPEDYFVVVMSCQRKSLNGDISDFKPNEWSNDSSPTLVDVLEDEGANFLGLLEEKSDPYIFGYQKGKGKVKEVIAETAEETVSLVFDFPSRWNKGNISSVMVGPAQSWNRLSWKLNDYDLLTDTVKLSLIGIDQNGVETILIDSIANNEYDLSATPATQYPYLRLELAMQDYNERTAPNLEYWRIHYKPLPEAMINTEEEFVFISDTLRRGDNLQMSYFIENISSLDMDSMLVKYSIRDAQNNDILNQERYSPLFSGDKIKIDYNQSTSDFEGVYELQVEVNPNEDQPELHHFNNIGIRKFFVLGDDLNPIIDVTFDGIHILNGDIISPEPSIKISLRDDNPLLPIDDINSFEITLIYPNEQSEVIDLNSAEVNFIPSTESESGVACLEFSPTLISGVYTIIIQGKDSNGNLSGDNPYRVSFEVIEDAMISNVLNYPNPFSTQTQFYFTLTGTQIPESFHIKVMTMSGKVVREITQEEFGPIRIGVNASSYKWDGKDEFGSRLANGVYLYKAYVSMGNDEIIEDLSLNAIDDFFTKGFGKLVIMR